MDTKSKALLDFKTKYPNVTSADLQTFILGMNSIKERISNIHADIIHKDGNYHIDSIDVPGFIKSMAFSDEYEAHLVYSAWKQYSKFGNTNYNEFQKVVIFVFRVIGVQSNWM